MIPLVAETWLWWSIVIVVFLSRFASRILHQGSVKNLQFDDWLMWFAIATYTTVIVTLNIVAVSNTNLFPPEFDYTTLTAADIAQRQYGSKMVLVVELCQCFTVWTSKACILIMYMRLTKGRQEHLWIKLLCAYTGLTFLLMEILYLGVWCRPFNEYWQVPTSNPDQCAAALHHLTLNAVFNLSSDMVLLLIALPMFIRTQMPVRQKAALCGVFGLGVFVMISAILNKYYSFTNPFGSAWTYWYCRESSTSMLVANLPFVYTLFRRILKLGGMSSTNAYATRSKKGSKTTGGIVSIRSGMTTLMSRNRDEEKGMASTMMAVPEEDPILDGIRKEVGVTFLSSPAWMGENRGHTVTIIGGAMTPINHNADRLAQQQQARLNRTSVDGKSLDARTSDAAPGLPPPLPRTPSS